MSIVSQENESSSGSIAPAKPKPFLWHVALYANGEMLRSMIEPIEPEAEVLKNLRHHYDVVVTPLYTKNQMQSFSQPTVLEGCQRSHPHEEMGFDCQEKTIQARANNQLNIERNILFALVDAEDSRIKVEGAGYAIGSKTWKLWKAARAITAATVQP